MNSIQFFGAAGMVTGSCSLLTANNGEQILIDLGMFQGDEGISSLNYEPLPFDPAGLSGVFLTHAHLDHSGRLPILLKKGFAGKIYMTAATKMLTALILADSAKIEMEDALKKHNGSELNNLNKQVLYTEEDVENLLSKVEEVEYDRSFSLGGFSITFRDAGHILGSASIEVSDASGKTIVFSGDLGNTPEDMIRPTENIRQADFVVMESTYGARIHRQEDPSHVLQEEINAVEKSKGVLLIPSFSIERAQEILHRINHLKNNKKIDAATKVFLDSPMSIRATEVFRRFPELYNQELSKESKIDDPFNFPGLVICQSAEESKAVFLNPAPKVIISGSGMMNGGRILHHAVNYLSNPSTRLLLVGYQAEGTLGNILLGGAKKVLIYNQEILVSAHIREVEAMSCHADQPKLLNWLKGIKGVQKVFLNHGEDESRKVLSEKIINELRIKEVTIPKIGESLNF